jgi:Heme exporter protein D (CcmD).
MSHDFYIYVSYGVSGLVIMALIGWVWLDGRARQRELKALEVAGVRRRSATAAGDQQA